MIMKNLKINGLKNHCRWEDISCSCEKNNVLKSHPIALCYHCKFDQAKQSMPSKCFIIKQIDNKGKLQDKEVTEITLMYGEKFDDLVGWSWQ